jgi:hypothetical protein
MEGLDGAGKAAVDKLFMGLYGVKPPWESDNPVVKDQLEQYVTPTETPGEPVSLAQAMERGAKEYGGKPVPLVMPPPPLPMSLSGDRSVYIGTARVV